MAESNGGAIYLENRHTGERLALRRVKQDDEVWLELKGSLPPHSEGPPMQVHFAENESGQVIAGSLSVVIDGRRMAVGPGRTTLIPHGAVHRWWNEGDQTLEVCKMILLGPLIHAAVQIPSERAADKKYRDYEHYTRLAIH